VASVLKAAARNSGSTLNEFKTSMHSDWIEKYVNLLVHKRLLFVDLIGNVKFYRPTELGYAFLIKQRELVDLLDSSDDPNLFHFWE
jgi:hypothetical protein